MFNWLPKTLYPSRKILFQKAVFKPNLSFKKKLLEIRHQNSRSGSHMQSLVIRLNKF